MDERRQSYWDLHDFSSGRGLEVGPLHRPMVTTDQADVRYVDVLDREGLLRHYAADPNVPADAIPEIDYHLIQSDGTTLGLAEVTKPGAPFDWVMASHVIEHVPDLIGWLGELAEVVADDGVLVLAVPDRRYCFDVHRPPTTVGQMIAANLAGDTRPNVAVVHDYFAGSVDYDVKDLWRGRMPHYDRRIHSFEEAKHHVERTLAGEYVDCHVWLFTPDSFLRQLHELRIIGHSAWIVERLEPTRPDDLEFRVVLRRIPRDRDAGAGQTGELRSEADLPDWLELQARGMRAETIEERNAVLEAKVDRLRARVDRLRTRSERQGRRVQRLRGRLREQQAAARPSQLPARAARSLARRLRRTRT